MTAPLIPSNALKSGETDLQVTGNLMRFIVTANLLGLPAISVPVPKLVPVSSNYLCFPILLPIWNAHVGYDKQGLPIGLQLIGRPWCEATILRLAAAIEELFASPKKKPMQFYDILKGN
ncbi:Hypothetical predicted protein [Olea europaea subsp. europaea]|uniref:Amidase domain-containing protein n=1 Tax=Olea europaea subsp. europaea TaxID=158383 RepID=A0A8S0QUY2_OLEEU|nr:Hypothetical predicted protein [Olea europaea subsp. europaea]